MLVEWIVKEKEVMYLTVFKWKVDQEDDHETDGETLNRY